MSINVILNLSAALEGVNQYWTYFEFLKLIKNPYKLWAARKDLEDIIVKYKKGGMTTVEFLAAIKAKVQAYRKDIILTEAMIKSAWNAMIKVSIAKINTLFRLAAQHGYKFYLTNNTNELHWQFITSELKKAGYAIQDDDDEKASDGNAKRICIEKDGIKIYVYLSFKFGMFKAQGLVQRIVDAENLDRGRTIYIDQYKDNIEGCSNLGIETYRWQQSSAPAIISPVTKRCCKNDALDDIPKILKRAFPKNEQKDDNTLRTTISEELRLKSS